MSSEKPVAIITGGGSGMGLAVSEYLFANGWVISTIDIDQKRGEEAQAKFGGLFTKTDVTNYDDQLRAFEATYSKYGRIDFVFANAGVVGPDTFYVKRQTPPPKPGLIAEAINSTGQIYSTYLGMHYLRKNGSRGGNIILTSSAAGLYPSYSIPIYTSSKFSAVGFARCVGPVLGRENIRVNVICPGAVPTNFLPGSDYEAFPQERLTTTENIVNGVVRLLKDPAASGQVLEISQGRYYVRPPHVYCDEAQEAVCKAAGGVQFAKLIENPTKL